MILDEDQEVWLDAFNMFLGQRLGRGQNREVYELKFDPDYVVKIEKGPRIHFQNILEWATWNTVAGSKYEKWFAPVKAISHEGRLLIMRKTEDVRASELPDSMPTWMCDFKPENFGMLDGKLVWRDYGKSNLEWNGLSNRLKKVRWRDGSSGI